MRLRARRLLVVHRPRPLVEDGQPEAECGMEQQGGKQPHFEHLYYNVSAHEMAEGVVPFAAVVPQEEQVGAGVKQQEETQESAQCGHEDLFGDRVDFGEVHFNSADYEMFISRVFCFRPLLAHSFAEWQFD